MPILKRNKLFCTDKPLRGAASGLVLLATAALVTGCGGSLPSLNPFSKEEVKLPGERISVMRSQDEIKVELATAKSPIKLPAAKKNTSWTQPGGIASNAPGHLEVGGGLRAVWRVSIGQGSSDDGQLTASPVVYQNRIYTIDTEGRVTAFSASGGSRVWRTELAPEHEKGQEGYGGGLAVDGGRLYAATGFGTVVALNPASGAVLWSKSIGVPIRNSPTADGGKVFFVTTENGVYCLKGEDGDEVWSFRGVPASATLLSNVSPAISGDTVVVPFSSGEVIAYRISAGKPAWVDSLSRSTGGSSLASLSDPARPVIDGGIVFAVGHSGRMIAVSQKTGERLWTRNVRGTQTPWVAGDAVFVVDEHGKLMALGRRKGQVRWIIDLPESRKWNGPVLASGKLWLASSSGLIVGVNAADGAIATKLNLDTPVFIAPVVAAGRMYVLTDNARLVALN